MNLHLRPSWKRTRFVCVGACAALSSVVVGSGVATAQESSTRAFLATAEASVAYVQYGIPGFLVVDNYVDGGGPVSQATMTSSGVSQSFASNPYPGATFVGYPGLVAFVFGTTPPGYPFFVNANYPTQPESKAADPAGTYLLDAKASEEGARGTARAGKPGSDEVTDNSAAISEVVVDDVGVVTATGRSIANAISLGPLSIASVRSESVTTYRQGDVDPITTTKFIVEGGRVGDLAFSFGPEGLKVQQQGVPLPAGEGLAAVNKAVEPAGLTISFQDAAPFNGGSAAGALEIKSIAEVPGAGNGVLRIRFGGATSAVSLGTDSATTD